MQQAARAILHHDSRNDSMASRMRSLYALLHRSLADRHGRTKHEVDSPR
ncbi:MAG: hypothetical protein KZQ66_09025 [Candidatus Thiodiazotropha sp. (ex Lucinoma aequizonata)]|nr:hypothetical protein [Candidatus Thiodiazotropha sp. (ex Lucinoma aequizonata)]MCU7896666.1 hypothetical protein [Candidatus Thiodiazotropha sp. (ex Lucinoma aequizonata)]MCU7897847.1 hypothetical protein [Candidatus Thiodiazotropha sp. (ex Lucinoma aequizonata)]MCU7902114.1 hypothetical protein [Candidatus Thiodiazotropha sp. (ex Lucinoma aequizonata)]MCU7907510.1 hypothetical protein [Candidatus Thiodiazotropha sp. (ex Lucinoma aequizonata)]